MNMVTRTIEIDSETDARLSRMADERHQGVSALLAETIALLDSTADSEFPDVEEDGRRYEEYLRTGMGVPWEEVKVWMASWGAENELPRPRPRRIS